ncbi:DUF1566 domain-containing protein [Thiospirillum jenense]|uniref:DUF1566 domain-containing protein n=1 Tax=Thiospirillum jenense TaxID=1653858 RepID=A0A839HEG4_9GAMM|nr:DUF1566 domain-containing protein [Thiospirillum jenense]MBB1125409.1 DUF1566 domain-containing protein [Thiospirillum jenense]
MRFSPVVYSMIVMLGSINVYDSTALAGNCGREESTTPDSGRFKDNGDGTLNDKDQNVMWKQCIEGLRGIRCRLGKANYFNWIQAQRKADNTVFAGYDDWRIPTDKELRSLIEPGCELPAINLAWFPRTPASAFWFNSPEADNSFRAGAVSFAYGESVSHDQKNVLYLRLVRSLPPSNENQPTANTPPAAVNTPPANQPPPANETPAPAAPPVNNTPPAVPNTPPANQPPTANETPAPPVNNTPPAAPNQPPTANETPAPPVNNNPAPPANNNPPAVANPPPANQPPAGAP